MGESQDSIPKHRVRDFLESRDLRSVDVVDLLPVTDGSVFNVRFLNLTFGLLKRSIDFLPK